jgi:hypothetical protein
MAEIVVCALEGCVETFEKRVHNQRFHSRECCRVYTNARILAAYHEKKQKVTTGRVCKSRTCDTLLSRYNDDDYCASCQQKQHRKKLKSWGWELTEYGAVAC